MTGHYPHPNHGHRKGYSPRRASSALAVANECSDVATEVVTTPAGLKVSPFSPAYRAVEAQSECKAIVPVSAVMDHPAPLPPAPALKLPSGRFFRLFTEGKNEPCPDNYPNKQAWYVAWSLWHKPQGGALAVGDRIRLRDERRVRVTWITRFAYSAGFYFRVWWVDLDTGEADFTVLLEQQSVERITPMVYAPPKRAEVAR